MAQETGMYGSHDFVTCKPYPDKTLSELLEEAVGRLHGQYEEPASELSEDKDTVIKEWLPATPDVKNYSYTKVGGCFLLPGRFPDVPSGADREKRQRG